MSDSITETEKIYDDYVKYYNDSGRSIGDHIRVLSEFSEIENKVNNREEEITDKIQVTLSKIIFIVKDIPEKEKVEIDTKLGIMTMKKAKRMALKFLELPKNKSMEFYDLINISFINHTIVKLLEITGSRDQELEIQLNIRHLEFLHPKLIHIRNHKSALLLLNRQIIDIHYPTQLRFYKELTDHEKSELRSNSKRVGAPQSEDVPQNKIEQIVKDLLKKYERGEKVETNSNGRKMMYQVIHDTGKREGKANINQIFKYFEVEHPNLLNISDRQFKERIKKAVPIDMK